MSNFVRAIVGDFSGNKRQEVRILPDEVSWLMNDVGRVVFHVGASDAHLHAGYYDFGNTLLLQFANGLPDWGGVFDPPRRWTGNSVRITAYSGEYLLSWRYTDKGRYFSGASPGAIYAALIEEGNAVEETGVVLGDVYTGNAAHSPDYHLDQVLRTIQDSVVGRLSDYEFAVVPALSGGRITFTANFYQRRGRDTGHALVEDKNIRRVRLEEQGPIVNDITIAGADTSGEGADGWGDGRITAPASDADSIARYRRRQYGNVFNDVSVQATLDGHAARLLAAGKEPSNVWSLDHLDLSPCRFRDVGLGDTVHLQAPSYGVGGTDTRVRILGRDYRPAYGVCALTIEENYATAQ